MLAAAIGAPLHRICRNHCRVSATESYPHLNTNRPRPWTFSWGTMVTRDRWTAGSGVQSGQPEKVAGCGAGKDNTGGKW
jgi:hypothetical protein